MSLEKENKNKLGNFFSEEYQNLKFFVSSKIQDSKERDAEDIIQDVALKLFARSGNMGPIGNAAGFVYRALRNKVIDALRQKGNGSSELELSENMELEESLEFEFSDKLKHQLRLAISELKPMYRDIIIAIDFEGLTY